VRFAVLALVGRGRVAFDPLAGGDAAAGDSTSSPDSGCTFSSWSNIVAQATLNGSGDEWEPALSPDGLSIVYVSYTASAGLYGATRSSVAAAFGIPRMLTELSTASVEHGPVWFPDGSAIIFTRELGTAQPMIAAYQGNATFAPPSNYDLPTTGSGFAISADAREVFMASDVGLGDYDLGHARRASDGAPWVLDSEVDSFNRVGAVEGFPALDEGRNDLYFEYGITSNASTIVVAHRAGPTSPFGAPVPADGVNVPNAITGDASLTENGLTLAFSSDRPGGAGGADIYIATRTCN
jgi:hypothetical protein